MMPDVFDEQFIVHNNVRLDSYARPTDHFFAPLTQDDVESVCSLLERLPDGSVLACRGRDFIASENWGRFAVPDTWDYGICTMAHGRCFFVWDTGAVESFPIRQVDHRRLVHFALARNAEEVPHTVPLAPDRVVIISHGYSPHRGPDYALVRALQTAAMRRGFCALVPSFVESYKFGAAETALGVALGLTTVQGRHAGGPSASSTSLKKCCVWKKRCGTPTAAATLIVVCLTVALSAAARVGTCGSLAGWRGIGSGVHGSRGARHERARPVPDWSRIAARGARRARTEAIM